MIWTAVTFLALIFILFIILIVFCLALTFKSIKDLDKTVILLDEEEEPPLCRYSIKSKEGEDKE